MMMERWDPFREMHRMERMMNRLWGNGPATTESEIETWSIQLDVKQEGDNLLVRAAVPGVKPDDINVTFEDGILTIKGQTSEEEERKKGEYLLRERLAGSFYRAVRLPDNVDSDKAQSIYENGEVTIAFPRQESKKAKQLKIEARRGSQQKQVTGKQ
ncbi:MAG: Hsp20/alpha crystallin family protein [SAR202 cluster bacterium]|nr:Hsp20/alpha crystallin family protein [SAR202 cluster bacterium]